MRATVIPYSKLRVYLFGSMLSSPTPNDIDLLIQYDNSTSHEDMLQFRVALRKKYDPLNLHVSLLQEKELHETNFLNKIQYIKIEI